MDRHSVVHPVFLSASEPSASREPGYWINRNLLNVREAVRAFCAHVMLHHPIVFGGHPAITPLVQQIADRVAHQDAIAAAREGRDARKPRVVTFQSRLFVDGEDDESMVYTPILDGDGRRTADKRHASRRVSLLRMRYEMLGSPHARPLHPALDHHGEGFGSRRHSRLRTYQFAAAVFIGGMEGVEREFNIFRDFHPDTPAYPVASTGSASQILLGRVERHLTTDMMRKLAGEPAYTLLMQELLPLPVARERAVASERTFAPHWTPAPRDESSNPMRHIDPEITQGPGLAEA